MTRRILALAALALAATLSPAQAQSDVYRVSAYCHEGVMCSGQYPRPGAVAVDTRVIPMGSTLVIEGLPGTYEALDTGGGVVGNWVDLFMPSCADALNWGVRYLSVEWWP